MSGRRRVGMSPSLFPFLAVLVCTLGTLILLLALVAQSARESVEQEVAQKLADEASNPSDRPTRAAVDSLIEEGKFRVAQLVSFRDSQTADLERRRDQVAHLDDHIRRVREELQQLSREVDLATADSPQDAPDQKQIEELRSRIEREQDELAKLRESAAQQKPRVVIVPHKGPNGTDRRPVYLECTASGLVILPEGSRITIEQLVASDRSANPLDAALRTIRLFALQNYGDTIAPYPLLVVRPDGIETYAAARQAMLDWDDQFGYELVPAEVDLAFAKPDSVLKQRVDVAIQQATVKQAARQMIANHTTTRGASPGRVRTLSAANLDRMGRTGGFQDHRDPSSSRNPYGSSANYGAGGYGNATDSGAAAARKLDEHLRSVAGEVSGSGDAIGSNGLPTSGLPQTGTNASAGSTVGTGSIADSNEAGTPGMAPGSGTGTGTASNNPATAMQPSLAANGTSTPSPTAGGSLGAGPLDPNALATGTEATGPDGSELNAPSNAGGAPSMDSDLTAAPNASDALAASSARGVAGGNGGMQAQGSAAGGTPTRESTGATSTNGSADENQQANSMSVSNSPPPRSSKATVKRQGRDWALPESFAGMRGTAVVRTIRVVCYADRFVLLPAPNGGGTEVFGFSDGEINRASLELATAVRDRIETWGPSLPGGRWQPRLEVEVAPEGVDRFKQFQALMNGSGVEVIGKAPQ